jgi:hypothetical protein
MLVSVFIVFIKILKSQFLKHNSCLKSQLFRLFLFQVSSLLVFGLLVAAASALPQGYNEERPGVELVYSRNGVKLNFSK